jgi:hypothetical protein
LTPLPRPGQAVALNLQPAARKAGEIGARVATTKTKISNGLLEIHRDLMELTLQENNFKAELRRVAEERSVLENRRSTWPAENAETPPQQHARRPKAKGKAAARRARPSGRGATVDVLGVLRASRSGEPLTVQEIKSQLPGLPAGSIHQALSVLKKRGHAKNPGLGKWAFAG